MAKGTIIFLFLLAIIASLLVGINAGKTMNLSLQISPTPSLNPNPPALTLAPTFIPLPTLEEKSKVTPTGSVKSNSTSTYTDSNCGFSFTYPGSYLNSKTDNGQSVIYFEADNPNDMIITACLAEIPKPPLPPGKIEDIKIGGISAKLYHDQSSKDGTPRDEVIVKHPTNGMEVIIAGYGPTFNKIIPTIKFIR